MLLCLEDRHRRKGLSSQPGWLLMCAAQLALLVLFASACSSDSEAGEGATPQGSGDAVGPWVSAYCTTARQIATDDAYGNEDWESDVASMEVPFSPEQISDILTAADETGADVPEEYQDTVQSLRSAVADDDSDYPSQAPLAVCFDYFLGQNERPTLDLPLTDFPDATFVCAMDAFLIFEVISFRNLQSIAGTMDGTSVWSDNGTLDIEDGTVVVVESPLFGIDPPAGWLHAFEVEEGDSADSWSASVSILDSDAMFLAGSASGVTVDIFGTDREAAEDIVATMKVEDGAIILDDNAFHQVQQPANDLISMLPTGTLIELEAGELGMVSRFNTPVDLVMLQWKLDGTFSEEPVQVGNRDGFVIDDDDGMIIVWESGDDSTLMLSAFNYPGEPAELISVAESVRPATVTEWADLLASNDCPDDMTGLDDTEGSL